MYLTQGKHREFLLGWNVATLVKFYLKTSRDANAGDAENTR